MSDSDQRDQAAGRIKAVESPADRGREGRIRDQTTESVRVVSLQVDRERPERAGEPASRKRPAAGEVDGGACGFDLAPKRLGGRLVRHHDGDRLRVEASRFGGARLLHEHLDHRFGLVDRLVLDPQGTRGESPVASRSRTRGPVFRPRRNDGRRHPRPPPPGSWCGPWLLRAPLRPGRDRSTTPSRTISSGASSAADPRVSGVASSISRRFAVSGASSPRAPRSASARARRAPMRRYRSDSPPSSTDRSTVETTSPQSCPAAATMRSASSNASATVKRSIQSASGRITPARSSASAAPRTPASTPR